MLTHCVRCQYSPASGKNGRQGKPCGRPAKVVCFPVVLAGQSLGDFSRDGIRGSLGPIGWYVLIGGSSEVPIDGNQEALGNIIMVCSHGKGFRFD